METFKKRQKEMGGWNASGIRPPNALQSTLARAAPSQAGHMPTSQPVTTPRHPIRRQLHPGWTRRSLMAGKRNLLEIRYLGFDQRENSRVYRFDVQTDGRAMKEVSVSANMVVFRDHRVGIQEGPFLSGNKLTADLGRGWEGEHELTDADVRAHADAKALAGRRTRQGSQGARRP
jgi:hypothetical protein